MLGVTGIKEPAAPGEDPKKRETSDGSQSTPGPPAGLHKETFWSNIPARLDRLLWNRFHTRLCMVLGCTWALIGLIVTLVGPLDPAIRNALPVAAEPVDLPVLIYLAGMTLGALLFSWLTDRLGRSKLIVLTVLVSLLGTIATGCAWDIWSFLSFRFIIGAGIGGAYVAVNSALQELIPAHYRGTTIISLNGIFWAGAMFSALASLVVLNPAISDPAIGWRALFGVGGVLVFVIMPLLYLIPESPRWLIARGQSAQAERIVTSIEAEGGREHGNQLPPEVEVIQLFRPDQTTILGAVRLMLRSHGAFDYRERTVLGLTLMASQAFLYNGIFFGYARQLEEFYHVPDRDIGRYMLPVAFSNLVGALVLSRLFDSIGRKQMITATYVLSGILLAITGLLFWFGVLDAWGHTACWMAIFFVASAAASSAYLTVGEAFPLEIRAMGIALLFAFGTAIGGLAIPLLFDWLVPAGASNIRYYSFILFAAMLMTAAGWVAWYLGFPAARRTSEDANRTLGEPNESKDSATGVN